MSLNVETGTGASNSESYISVVDADTYFAARGNATWAALDVTTKEQCLRKATDYMQEIYRGRWQGLRVVATQALDWPRAWIMLPDGPAGYRFMPAYVPFNSVPAEVSRACAELAVRASVQDLLADTTQQVTRTKVGPIEVDYDRTSSQSKQFLAVNRLLRPYLTGGTGTVALVRT